MNMKDDILIVDDEIPNLRLLTELLEKEGYQVRPTDKAHTIQIKSQRNQAYKIVHSMREAVVITDAT